MKKLSKILGVVVALTMLLSTFAFSTPVAADDEDWSLFTLPDIGAASDYFMDTAIAGFSAFAMATDGTLYLYEAGYTDLFKSDDGGRTWEETDFLAEAPGAAAIVDIACSSDDPDIVYCAGVARVWKTDDAGDNWTEVGAASIAGFLAAVGDGDSSITSIDVGYVDSQAYVFIGTADLAGDLDYDGAVGYKEEFTFGGGWTDLTVDATGDATVDIYAVNCSPDFDSDATTFAVATDATGPKTWVVSNAGADVGDWADVAQLQINDVTPIRIAPVAVGAPAASNFCFVADFDVDDEFEMFIGVSERTAGGLGDVFRVNDGSSYCQSVDADIASLDVVGDSGGTSLLAGTAAAPASIWYSTDDGDSWDETDKAPGSDGAGNTNLVIVADDFADSGEAWAASSSATEGGVHLTTDFGASWNGISMLDTNMNLVAAPGAALDIAFTPGYSSDSGTMFAVTVDTVGGGVLASVWSFDGTYWERIWADTVNALDLVQTSPDFNSDNTMYVADSGAGILLRSDDGGATWDVLNRDPSDVAGWATPITAWLVVDDQTIFTADAGAIIYKTARYGRRAWDDVATGLTGNVTDFAMSPAYASDGTLIAGDTASCVYISTDEGEEWDGLSDSDVAGFVTAVNDTYVCFDPNFASNKMLYAASDDVVARCEYDSAADPGDQEFDDFVDAGTPPVLTTGGTFGAGGIVASNDSASTSTLYVLDGVAGAGMWRALDPFQDIGDITFENVVGTIGGAVDFSPNVTTVSSTALTSGSNRIWAIDCAVAAADNVWEYTDNLAAPVVLSSPTDAKKLEKTDWVNFQWTALADTVTNYVIEAFTEKDEPTDSAALTGTENVSTWDDINLDGLIDPGEITWTTADTIGINTADTASYIWRAAEAGTTYYWRVQVDGPVLSRYSSIWSFMTKVGAPAAPVNVRPEPGASDVILRPTFGWLAIDGATIYKIIVASDPAFANVVASGDSAINVWALPADVADLVYSTTYYWKVWGEAASGAPAGDPVISAFTTAAEPAKPTPAVIVNPTPPAPPAPIITLTMPEAKTPPYVWAIIGIGGVLVIALVVLIARTRRVI
jgi:hypothetical protein